MLNAEIKQRWLNALRSGSYEQAHGKLSNGSGFCCLGVLCEIAVEDQIVVKVEYDEHSVKYVNAQNRDDYGKATLPVVVSQWAGLSTMPDIADLTNPSFEINIADLPSGLGDDATWYDGGGSKVRASLASLNDNGATFEQIANLIEKYF